VSPSVATFLFEAANFLVLAAVLGWAFFRPVQNAIERRRAGLETERRDCEQARADVQRELAEAEARRREVEASLSPLRAEARREADRQAAAILEKARTQAAEEHGRLEDELAALRRENARTLARDAAGAAGAIVARLLAEIGGPDLDAALARAACDQLAALPETKRARPVDVEAARPLEPETRARLANALGPGVTVNDRVVPELLAGLRIVTHAGVVDASASSLAAWAERELLARIAPGEEPGG
jgi:F0F1-type ATP synthase membrane subunit b/b'